MNDFKLLTLLNIGSLAKVELEAEKEKADDQEKKDEGVLFGFLCTMVLSCRVISFSTYFTKYTPIS